MPADTQNNKQADRNTAKSQSTDMDGVTGRADRQTDSTPHKRANRKRRLDANKQIERQTDGQMDCTTHTAINQKRSPDANRRVERQTGELTLQYTN